MNDYPEPIERMIEKFRKLPGIGRKSAERLTFQIIRMENREVEEMRQALYDVKVRIHPCEICGNLTDEKICHICRDERRDQQMICVVEDVANLVALERSEEYRGAYHVLHGLISPLNEISYDNINLDSLLQRIEKGDIREVILAISPTIDGEMTTLFIRELLAPTAVEVTRIASGIPMGGSLEYFDSATINKALEDRKKI